MALFMEYTPLISRLRSGRKWLVARLVTAGAIYFIRAESGALEDVGISALRLLTIAN